MRPTLVSRVIAGLLVLGGLSGLAMAGSLAYDAVQTHWIYLTIAAAFGAVFVASTLAGVRLWRGDPRGWRWARILFAAQVPVFTVPGATWEFYTGVGLPLAGGAFEENLTLRLGGGLTAYLDTRITAVAYGVNLVAVLVLAYLLRVRVPAAPQPPAATGAGTAPGAPGSGMTGR